jgi:hypothetical protein
MIHFEPVSRCTLVVTTLLLAACGSFGTSPASGTNVRDASSTAGEDAAGEDAAGKDAGADLPSPQECLQQGASLVQERFDLIPPQGWNRTDTANALSLDTDPEDVVSKPTSFRAGITARTSGTARGLILRNFQQSFAGTICVTFQGRLFMGTEGFGATPNDVVGIVDLDLRSDAGDARKVHVGLVVTKGGLRMHVVDDARDDLTAPPIDHGDGAYEQWTLVMSRMARKAGLWVGAEAVTLPFDLPFDPGFASIAFGVSASGQVPTTTFHMDDLRIAILR